MKLSHFFIEHPIFASVIWIIICIMGGISYFTLPIEQYPQVVPPTIVVNAKYPGANAETIAKTVATPIEQEINGVENMIYLSSQSTNDGSISITVTFSLGTDLDKAQILVQNRVAIAQPRLPQEVQRQGVTVKKNSPDLMLVVNLFSTDGRYDQTYIANYATLQIINELARVNGVGDIRVFGASPYSMRIWLDPDKIASLNMTPAEVVSALQKKNVQVASGTLGSEPVVREQAFELNVQTTGRLIQPEQFAEIVVKSTSDGRIVRVKDIGRVELGAQSYDTRGYLGKKKAVALPIFQRPGSNALKTANEIRASMDKLSKKFPTGLAYTIVYDPTQYIKQSMLAVFITILEAILLVVIVIMLFLQSWRASIIPIIAIPLSLIGTLAMMSALGLTLNYLTLFGLVLAIGIVVDDAIVVVENMERLLTTGVTRKEAAHKTMDEVGGALIAMGLVLVAAFLPILFAQGLSGRFFQQFGTVISIATLFSIFISLTLSPALAALLLKNNAHENKPSAFHPLRWIYKQFDRGLQAFSGRYFRSLEVITGHLMKMMVLYCLLMASTVFQYNTVPTGFIPQQDQGYFIIAVQLPPAASLARTEKVIQTAVSKILTVPGIKNTVAFAGFNGATFTSATNAGAIFSVLESFSYRKKHGINYDKLFQQLQAGLSEIPEAMIVVIPPPPVRGIGSGGGFKMMVQDREGLGIPALNQAVWQIVQEANQLSAAKGVFSFYEINTPQLYINIDAERAERLGVSLDSVYETLNIFLGSAYINDFNYLGRTYQVTAKADIAYSDDLTDLNRLKVRNSRGQMVPLTSLGEFENRSGPARQPRFNLYPAAEIQGNTAPGHSTGETLQQLEKLAQSIFPQGISFEWTELAYQEKLVENSGLTAFGLAVVFVFLLLAALYESWLLPLAIILIVPMCLLSAMTGVSIAGLDNNILTQIGLVVLIGLASKNAILIVEFAKQNQDQFNITPVQAAIAAAKVRLRPILMTSFAFILGVMPLMMSTGAGAEMRRALGVAVFSGMLGVTFFGLIFTPVFYVLCRKIAARKQNAMSEK